MAKGVEPLLRSVEQLKEGAKYLKIADQLVREGKYEAALKEIARARSVNPSNLYALAYEDRVRSLLQVKELGGKNSSKNLKPTLEQLSSLAVAQAERPLENELKMEKHLSQLQKASEEKRSLEDVRKAAIQEKTRGLISRVIDYQAKRDFTRALAEIDRAYLLDPSNEQVKVLESQIQHELKDAVQKKEKDELSKNEEELRFRNQVLSAENKRVEQQLEEKRAREEEARRVAQERKVTQYIERSKELLATGQLDDALSELAFVVVIDPLNEDVLRLEREIRAKMEKDRKDQLAWQKKREEERVKRIDAIRLTIQKHIANARELVDESDFDEALKVITRAYVIDPVNKDLQECESWILSKQEEALHIEEHRKLEEQQRLNREREQELRKLEEQERIRLLGNEEALEGERRKEDKSKIREYLARARQYAINQRFESALGELALAFIIDPFDEDVKGTEKEVLEMRLGSPVRSPVNDEDHSEEIKNHIANAEFLSGNGEHEDALKEIAKGLALDPLNDSLQQLDERIQRKYRLQQGDQETKQEDVTPNARQHLWRAMDFLDRSQHEDALAEVGRGLSLEPDNVDLKTLQDQIDRSLSGRAAIDECVIHAGEFLSTGEYRKALEEVKKGLEGSPESIELLGLRSEIEKAAAEEAKLALSEAQQFVDENDLDAALARVHQGLAADPEDKNLLRIQSSLTDSDAESNRQKQIREYIVRGRDNFKAGAHEEALAQIALGLTLDPNNEELRDLERRVWKAADGDSQSDVDGANNEAAIGKHITQALAYEKENKFTLALDEVAKAYVINPLNKEIRNIEQKIRQAEMLHQTEDTPLKLIYPDKKRVGHP